jgi:hypothetical protein
MRGPMDSAIQPDPGGDKARRRLEEFIEQRYPGGVPPASSPTTDQPPEEPSRRGKRPAKAKRARKRKDS